MEKRGLWNLFSTYRGLELMDLAFILTGIYYSFPKYLFCRNNSVSKRSSSKFWNVLHEYPLFKFLERSNGVVRQIDFLCFDKGFKSKTLQSVLIYITPTARKYFGIILLLTMVENNNMFMTDSFSVLTTAGGKQKVENVGN